MQQKDLERQIALIKIQIDALNDSAFKLDEAKVTELKNVWAECDKRCNQIAKHYGEQMLPSTLKNVTIADSFQQWLSTGDLVAKTKLVSAHQAVFQRFSNAENTCFGLIDTTPYDLSNSTELWAFKNKLCEALNATIKNFEQSKKKLENDLMHVKMAMELDDWYDETPKKHKHNSFVV